MEREGERGRERKREGERERVRERQNRRGREGEREEGWRMMERKRDRHT